MRKICLWASFLIFLLGFCFFVPKTYAATEDLSVLPSSQPEVSYELPYPGLLPDSPLYFLRVIRDKTIEFLISDPLKKAEFYLLQADKRLNAGIYLFNKGKISLALSTVSKAENYFGQAIGELSKAKIQGRTIDEMQGRLKSAVGKHKQELEKLVKNVDPDTKASFEQELKRVIDFEVRLSK